MTGSGGGPAGLIQLLWRRMGGCWLGGWGQLLGVWAFQEWGRGLGLQQGLLGKEAQGV